MRVFAVWEPILPADAKPAAAVVARLADRRVSHFWDQQHVLAKRLAEDSRDPQPKPTCCNRNGILWDLAALYRPGELWRDRAPPALIFDGPVVRVHDRLAEALTGQRAKATSGR